MLKKFIKIKSIGRFSNYSCVGDIEFRKINIIYSENGRGKTTLSNILRSLKDGNSEFIEGRRTLGGTDTPEVEILLDIGKASYKNKQWTPTQYKSLEIFDSFFITQNIYSGYIIDNEQKRCLYQFIIGEQGIDLAKKYQDNDNLITQINQEIKEKNLEISKYIAVNNIPVDAFVKLSNIDDIDKKIIEQENLILSLSKVDDIRNKQTLKEVHLPSFDVKKLAAILQKTLDQLLDQAENRVKEHINSCMDTRGEKWVQYGLNFIKDNKCPFCGQVIDQIDLVTAYKSYFSKEYNELKQEIDAYQKSINDVFSQNSLLSIQAIIGSNISLIEFWKEYIDYNYPQVAFDSLKECWLNLSEAAVAAIETKKDNPLEKVDLGEEALNIVAIFSALLESIETYNNQIKEVNVLISRKKESLTSADMVKEKNQLNTYKNVKCRYSDNVKNLCNELADLQCRKLTIEKQKKQSRDLLDKYNDTTFEKYENSINKYLSKFGASFSIKNCKPSYIGRKPNTNYYLNINNVSIDLGSSESPIGEPCFKNTLSEGDKSTLALAFFLAKLEYDLDITNKIIIFDDPISSFDIHRKNSTVYQILGISKKAKQVCVLTHDANFARNIWKDNYDNKLIRVLCIKRDTSKSNQESILCEWDIEKETQGEYYQNYMKLSEFLEKGSCDDLLSVVRCIRPLLEGNLRLRFPKEFSGEGKWLGNFIDDIRNADRSSPLFAMKCHLDNLEEVNNYSKRYHHSDGVSVEKVGELELSTNIKTTLKLISGILS